MSHNVYAYTAPTPVSGYPEYLSVNVEEDHNVSITVRSSGSGANQCGDTARIVLSPAQLRDLARTLFSFACTGNA